MPTPTPLLPAASYDLIVWVRYVNAALMPHVLRRLSPGGHLVCEQHLTTTAQRSWDRAATHSACSPTSFANSAKELSILDYREGLVRRSGRPHRRARAARGPPNRLIACLRTFFAASGSLVCSTMRVNRRIYERSQSSSACCSSASNAGLGQEAPTEPRPTLPRALLEERGATIRSITIVVDNVFDPNNPEEDKALYRWANRVHVRTRPSVIENILLFDEGDLFQGSVLDESARALRAQGFLAEATVEPGKLRRSNEQRRCRRARARRVVARPGL